MSTEVDIFDIAIYFESVSFFVFEGCPFVYMALFCSMPEA